jgi:hypothetical protein
MDEFIIIRLSDDYPPKEESINFFFDAKVAATFMWGRQFGKFLIYKNGKLASDAQQYPEISKLEKYLEGDIL